MSEAIAQKLDEARALIEKGWCQDTYAKDGCYCAMGAIAKAVNGEPWRMTGKDWEAIFDALRKATQRHPGIWNDQAERTQAEVIEAFKKAAELARGEA